MNPTQAENLRILIRHAEGRMTRTLNMCSISEDCGAPACMIGEARGLPEFRGLSVLRYFDGTVVSHVVGLRLFGLPHDNAWKRKHVTPTEWALEARKVLAENGYAMDIPTIAERIAGVVSGNVMTPDDIAGTRIAAFEEKMQTAYYDFPQVRK